MRLLFAGILATGGLAGVALAEDAEKGEALFEANCAVCHGWVRAVTGRWRPRC